MQFTPTDVLFLKRQGVTPPKPTLSEEFDVYAAMCNERNQWRTMYQSTMALVDKYDAELGAAVKLAGQLHRAFCFTACAAAGFALLSVVLWVTR